jgi:hypothetical protein
MNTTTKIARKIVRTANVWNIVAKPSISTTWETEFTSESLADTKNAFLVSSKTQDLTYVQSETDPSKGYWVAIHVSSDRKVVHTCNCPDFKYRRAGNGTVCKHIAAAIGVALVK